MKSKTFSVVVQKNINPYLYLQKIICWAKEDRLTKKWESQKKILARKRTERSNARQLNAIMHNDLNSCRGIFLKKVREGPSYICSACNRLLYRKTVTELKKANTSFNIFLQEKSLVTVKNISVINVPPETDPVSSCP